MSSLPPWARSGRSGWRWTGEARPPFAERPGPGQESVWDYPRPPVIDPDPRHVLVRTGATVLADTRRAVRVLETASPPTFYLPPEDVATEHLERAAGSSRCEWKGEAVYWDVLLPGERLERVAWSYPEPFEEFQVIRDWLSFYPARVECRVGGHRVEPQPGRFYGGWVTPELVGPFKGEPGSGSW